jgi:hypothetical protein
VTLLLVAAALADQVLRIEVLAEPRTWDPAITAVLHRPAGDERLHLEPLTDRAGFYGATLRGAPVRVVDIELENATQGRLWRKVVAVDGDDVTISFRAEEGRPVTRVAWIPAYASFPEGGNVVSLAMAFGWGALCLGYVTWLARARR